MTLRAKIRAENRLLHPKLACSSAQSSPIQAVALATVGASRSHVGASLQWESVCDGVRLGHIAAPGDGRSPESWLRLYRATWTCCPSQRPNVYFAAGVKEPSDRVSRVPNGHIPVSSEIRPPSSPRTWSPEALEGVTAYWTNSTR